MHESFDESRHGGRAGAAGGDAGGAAGATFQPDLVIAGAPRAGTTALFRWLADHPGTVPALTKETEFLSDPALLARGRPARHVRRDGAAGWADCFPPGAHGLHVEATPAYLLSATARAHLARGHGRVLIVLRDPAAQLASTWTYFRENWGAIPRDLRFADWLAGGDPGAFGGHLLAARPVETVDYLTHLRAWRDAVGRDRLEVTTFEALMADPRGRMRALAGRLGLDPGFYDDYAFTQANAGYGLRAPGLHRRLLGLRARLAGAPGYGALRAAYRALNTRPPDAVPPLPPALAARLAAQIGPLEAEFGLDLSAWRAAAPALDGAA